ncbi:MAG: ribosome silencing factor [Planctomycetales bacterium]|nr:ribosome silencing factor [Planctomycetales bacterium]
MATAIQSVASVSPQRSLQLALAAAQSAEDNKGQNVTVLDLRDQTVIFDYFVIATGSSQRQLRAISDAIDDVLQKELGHPRLGTEGYQDSKWILLDYGSIVVHVFDTTSRDYYALEDLWAGAKKVAR